MRPFKRRKQAEKPNRSEALECTPVKNDQIKESRLESGELLLNYPVTIRPWLASVFRRLGGNSQRTVWKKLQLDPLGTEVWELIDGDTRVRDVIGRFASTHRLSKREAEVAVTRFLWDLGKRGLIGLR
jgi:hypothetical protein